MECTQQLKMARTKQIARKKYKARKGSRLTDQDAQEIGKELEKNEGITTEGIVKLAQDKKSPFHKHFEWDDTKAGYLYRLQQARDLTASIVETVIINGKETEQRSFCYVVDEEEDSKIIVTLKTAVENESYKKQLLNRAITTLENLTITLKMYRDQEQGA